jgi:transposase-like protein
MNSNLNAQHFKDEQAAYAYVESWLWPTGAVCPHCANCDQARIRKLAGKSTRPGLHKCNECRKQFTVKIGTIFEDSHAPMTHWLQAIYLMCSSKKGISTRQLQRMLGGSMKTAWFMGHRIRLAMAPNADAGPLGGSGVTVEADETYLAKSPKTRKPAGTALNTKTATQVFSLVERGGAIRSMFIERGLVGVYQHMDNKHLDRYLAEFDFRQNNREKLGVSDVQRTGIAIAGARGKRLTYETVHQGTGSGNDS